MILLKNGEIPGEGSCSVLLAGERIVLVDKSISFKSGKIDVVDCSGLRILPGLIDPHIHLAGAGGEGGPATRTAELTAADLAVSGITTCVASLGADGFTRSLTNLLFKVRQLNGAGFSCLMTTGAYQFPLPSVTGDIYNDIVLIPEIIGVGEIALADHRSVNPSQKELFALVARARLAGMVAGKAGIVIFHLGDEPEMFLKIEALLRESNLKFRNLAATHCNRNRQLFEESKRAGKLLHLDLTTSSYEYFTDVEVKPSRAVRELLESGVPAEKITLSSDAGGSLPDFDERGNLVRIFTAKPHSLLRELRDLVVEENIPLPQAVKFFSTNAAALLGLHHKGRIAEGLDADIALVDEHFGLRALFARGRPLVLNGKTLV